MFPEFKSFASISRFSREIVITEKIDGTNGLICITENGGMFFGSRTRWITPQDDNFGFAAWGEANKEDLLKLDVGYHYGEWWGQGIQRRYALTERRFSLFNTNRWEGKKPECCSVVPQLYKGNFSEEAIQRVLNQLQEGGSIASPGFMNPEGIVIFHTHSKALFKKTIKNDDKGKSYGG